ncbi:MAG: type II secretion system protein [Planctomycetota bacterium]
MKRQYGFTLVELLIVIAIIALLLSIMVPVLEKARSQAQQMVCKSNLHQLHIALQLYAHDNSDKAPPVWDLSVEADQSWDSYYYWPAWPYRYVDYIAHLSPKLSPWDPLWKKSPFWCPALKKSTYHYPRYDFSAYSANTFFGGRYNIAKELDITYINCPRSIRKDKSIRQCIRFRFAEVKSPTEMLAWIDSGHRDSTGNQQGRLWLDFDGLSELLVKGGSTRHHGKSSYMFVDGHAQTRSPEEFTDFLLDK